jgi:prevent-host-death family protein
MAELAREITQRELRNDSGAIMRGVERGESFTITRNGTPIGRLVSAASPDVRCARGGPGRLRHGARSGR